MCTCVLVFWGERGWQLRGALRVVVVVVLVVLFVAVLLLLWEGGPWVLFQVFGWVQCRPETVR